MLKLQIKKLLIDIHVNTFFNNMKCAKFTNLFLEFFEKNFFGINITYHYINIKFLKVKNKNPFKINSVIKKSIIARTNQ